MSNATYYRVYELPWTPSEEEQRRLRRILGAVLGVFLGLGIAIPLLPVTPRPQSVAPPVPARIVEFILERPKPAPEPVVEQPPPPKPLLEERPAPERRTERPAARDQAEPDPRKKAASSGLLALADQLDELRDREVSSPVRAVQNAAGATTTVDRALLTARVGQGSGGIAVAAVSNGFGGGAAALEAHETAKVAAARPAVAAEPVERSGRSVKGSRTREEIELVFDRNKSAIYALYSRALRENPSLQGKVVLELTIAPSGEVSSCRIVSSELGDAELERKLVARVKMFRFEGKDVAPMTTTKPIEFFPA